LALARVRQMAEATKVADQTYVRCPNSATMLLQASDTYAICATKLTTDDNKQALAMKALTTLERAITAGWKDARLIERDPQFAPVRSGPSYKLLMSKIENSQQKP